MPIQLAVGLTALTLTTALLAGAIVLAALSTYLTDQLNAQVEQLSSTAAEALHEAGEHDGKGSDRRGLSGDAIAAGFDASGDYSSAAGPDVSAGTRDAMAAWLSAGRPWASGSVMSDVTLDGDDYRVLVSTRSDGSTLMSGLPADPVSETIEQLLKLEVLVGAVAIGVVAIGTYCFVRWRLIPIRRLADGASSLAVDDGSLRLDDESGSAEIAALSESLTLMLNRIDESMSAKSQAEARLRQFVADASHELRTPLASIRGYAEVLRRGLAVDPQDRDLPLDRIESETVRLAGLVNDLLLLATLDEDQPLRLARLDLGPLVAQCAADSEAADPRRQLSVLMADQEFWIDGDGDRLTQVFANLLGNVRAHTAPGSHAEIELEQDTSNIIVKVSDRGPGIPAASLPTIFDRFARADTGRARNQGGSGLGLAIVESIVHAHHGTIQIANREGGGLVVTLTLPRAGVEPGARGRASD